MIFKDVSERRKALEACGNAHWTRLSSTVAQSQRGCRTHRGALSRGFVHVAVAEHPHAASPAPSA